MKGTQTIAHVSSLLILQKIITLNDGGGDWSWLAAGRWSRSLAVSSKSYGQESTDEADTEGAAAQTDAAGSVVKPSTVSTGSDLPAAILSSQLTRFLRRRPPHPHPRGPGASSSPRPEFLPPEGLTGSP